MYQLLEFSLLILLIVLSLSMDTRFLGKAKVSLGAVEVHETEAFVLFQVFRGARTMKNVCNELIFRESINSL